MNPVLMPVVAAQGLWVRSSLKLLPPAGGPTAGTVGEVEAGNPVRIAIVGESTAAGCGVDSHDEAIAGNLARVLAERTGRPVEWEAVGQYGATGRRIRYKLIPEVGHDVSAAVLLAGANDVLSRRTPAEWAEDVEAIVEELCQRAEQVVVTGIPPFKTFPSLPGTLRRHLSRSAAAFDEASRRVCAERPRATFISSTDAMPMGADFFSGDRFHPSAYGYARWAEGIAEQITLTALA